MNCATGYALQKNRNYYAPGDRVRLIKVFRMDTQHVDGKIRCKAFTDRKQTDSFLTVIEGTVDFEGEKHKLLQFPTEDLPCPNCSAYRLKFYFNNPEYCPQCGSQALHKHVSFGPLLAP